MKLRIGTRRSILAKWQAQLTADKLAEIGIQSELVEIESFGDKEQDMPIHKLGDKGVFTKALDDALLKKEIDIAVHSLKDVPTDIIGDLTLAAVLERGNPADVLVRPRSLRVSHGQRTIATGSIRRKAFWKNKYPKDEVVGLRGNVQTRLKKIDSSKNHGGIFAYAGLERVGLMSRITEVLDWMIPAPAQGAIGIVARDDATFIGELKSIEHFNTRICVDLERAFMNELEAGCSSPLAAHATIDGEIISFHGVVLSADGSERLDAIHQIKFNSASAENGRSWARTLKEKGAGSLLKHRSDDE